MKELVDAHRQRWMALPGVIGVGVGLSQTSPNRTCILVYITGQQRPAELEHEIEGVLIEVVRTEPFRAT
ncbi:MAG TPA: hypothetical protein PKD54_02920 [Pirellulaceae bacterium]|nr:hypothetical protein [Pirellulaceae bacterium]